MKAPTPLDRLSILNAPETPTASKIATFNPATKEVGWIDREDVFNPDHLISATVTVSYDSEDEIWKARLLAGASAVVSLVTYTTSEDIDFPLYLTEEGYIRFDRMYWSASGEPQIIEGPESEGAAVPPPLPLSSVLITDILVTSDGVDQPEPPQLGDLYIPKAEQRIGLIHAATSLSVITNFPINDRCNFTLREFGGFKITEVKGFQFGPSFEKRPGQIFTFRNNQGVDVIFRNESADPVYKFYLTPETDFVLKARETIVFRLDATMAKMEQVIAGAGGVTQDQLDEAVEPVNQLALNNPPFSYPDKYASKNPLSYKYVIRTSSTTIKVVYVYGDKAITYQMELNTGGLYWWLERVFLSDIDGNGLAVTAGEQTLATNVQEFAVQYHKAGTGLANKWFPFHGSGSSTNTTLISAVINIDGITYSTVADIPVNTPQLFDEVTFVQGLGSKYDSGDADFDITVEVATSFDEKQLRFRNNYQVLKDIEAVNFYGARLSGNTGTTMHIDNNLIATNSGSGASQRTGYLVNSIMIDAPNFYATNQVDNLKTNHGLNQPYFSVDNTFVILNNTSSFRAYWNLAPSIPGGGVATLIPADVAYKSGNNVMYFPKTYGVNDIDIDFGLTEGLARQSPAVDLSAILATSITDGDTTHAPDGNAVYDALTAVNTAIAGKYSQPTAATTHYLRGDGSTAELSGRIRITPVSTDITSGSTTKSTSSDTIQEFTWRLNNAMPRQLKDFYTDVSNVGTTETDLYSYTIPANTLSANGQKIVFEVAGVTSIGAASRLLRVFLGAEIIGYESGLGIGAWNMRVMMIRTGTSTARVFTTLSFSQAVTPGEIINAQYNVTGLNFTTTNVLKITGSSGTASGDITAKMGNIVWHPAAV